MTKYESIKLGVYDQMKAELDQLRAENNLMRLERKGSDEAYLALALQVKTLREALEGCVDMPRAHSSLRIAQQTLATLPDNHTEIIAAHDAQIRKAALLEAAEEMLPKEGYAYDRVEMSVRANLRQTVIDMAGEVKG